MLNQTLIEIARCPIDYADEGQNIWNKEQERLEMIANKTEILADKYFHDEAFFRDNFADAIDHIVCDGTLHKLLETSPIAAMNLVRETYKQYCYDIAEGEL